MIVVGVDGANPETVLDPARRGSLANLGSVLADGIGGPLRSRTTSSAAAWTSHLTGTGPKDSGITGFTIDNRFVRTTDIAVQTYPELLDEAGLRVGLINVPLTYPPLELANGFCVPGQLTPLDEDEYTHPPAVQDVLDDFDYEVDIQYGERQYAFVDDELDISREEIREDVIRVERKRLAATRRLLAEREWDLFFVLVNGTDPLQHYYWHEIVDTKLEDTSMFEVYELIDAFVGDIREEYPNEDVLLFSDHGFREDVWGSDATTRECWRRIRGFGSRLLPESLKQTRLRQYGMDLLARSAKATTTTDDENRHTGAHDPEGVWLFGGPSVSGEDEPEAADFLDLPATILHVMGQSVPEAYEGVVRTDVLTASDEPRREDVDLSVRRRERVDADMDTQLAHLGYVEMVEPDETDT